MTLFLQKYLPRHLLQLTCVLMALLTSFWANATMVQFQTTLGDFEVNLFDEEAPVTVANFLTYVDEGDYTNTMIHRVVTDAIIQGGGFTFEDTGPAQMIPLRPTIINEARNFNNIGTIAMAKMLGDEDSAQSQWFINLSKNRIFDSANGGYTVFGEVMGDGMDVVNAIGALRKVKLKPADDNFLAVPVHDYLAGLISEYHIVYVYAIVRIDAQGNPIASSSSSSESSASSELSSASTSSTSSQLSSSSLSLSSSSSANSENDSSSTSSSSISSSDTSSSVQATSSVISSAVSARSTPSTSSGGGGSFGFVGLFLLSLFGRRIHIKTH